MLGWSPGRARATAGYRSGCLCTALATEAEALLQRCSAGRAEPGQPRTTLGAEFESCPDVGAAAVAGHGRAANRAGRRSLRLTCALSCVPRLLHETST